MSERKVCGKCCQCAIPGAKAVNIEAVYMATTGDGRLAFPKGCKNGFDYCSFTVVDYDAITSKMLKQLDGKCVSVCGEWACSVATGVTFHCTRIVAL
jgi:hypothetical protein